MHGTVTTEIGLRSRKSKVDTDLGVRVKVRVKVRVRVRVRVTFFEREICGLKDPGIELWLKVL